MSRSGSSQSLVGFAQQQQQGSGSNAAWQCDVPFFVDAGGGGGDSRGLSAGSREEVEMEGLRRWVTGDSRAR